MGIYTISDSNNTQSADSHLAAAVVIRDWYRDQAEWATGHATAEQHQIVRDAIDSVDMPEFGDSLQAYADAICTAIAEASGGQDFFGHGNYAVRTADQMGLRLQVSVASAPIEDDIYFLHPEGSDWIGLKFRGGAIVGMSCGADLGTHDAAGDSWAGVAPSDDDEELGGEIAATIVAKWADYRGADISADCVSVARASEGDE